MPKQAKVGGKFMEKDIMVKATIYKHDTLFLRVSMAEAKDPKGKEYEVASNINGDSVLVRRSVPTSGPWMAISSESLVRAYAQQVEDAEK